MADGLVSFWTKYALSKQLLTGQVYQTFDTFKGQDISSAQFYEFIMKFTESVTFEKFLAYKWV